MNQIDLNIVSVLNNMTDEYDTTNYAAMLNDLNNTRRNILKMLAIHKFMRLSREAFFAKSESPTSQKINTTHTVSQFETPTGIALKYKMTLEDLLKKNNITTTEFTPGLVLKVELDDNGGTGELSKVYEDIPTFGSQEGILVLGKDTGNDLKCVDGDLKILEPEDTVAQGVMNRLMTDSLSYPYEDEFGVRSLVGSELPFELIQGMYLLEINNQLNLDKRIESIESISVERVGNGITISGVVQAINNTTVNI
ncbi:MAG: LysM peptidoglycan-binding domain-containing protein [Candidatus Aquicultor sp.]